MCGIAGFWDTRHRFGGDEGAAVLRAMTRRLRHRGPDDEGYFQEANAGLALGHRRLSIIDLSPEGHQPMVSPSGRYAMVFNGEVYNHKHLRADLEKAGFTFRGHSDTEAMLAAIEHWGLDEAVKRFNGMFAFALWDRKDRTLALVRDRLGIKPLYYGWIGSLFVFASELKAIAAIPGFSNPVDRNALSVLLRHSYIPAPYSIYENVFKLMPGTLLKVDTALAGAAPNSAALASRTSTYWSAREMAEAGITDRRNLSDTEAVAELDQVLRDAVALRMEADVPLGAFLSGGVDSSTVVALMQAQSARPVRTFSIGFHEAGYNEAEYAKAVAAHLGTDHTELYVTARQAMDAIPRLPEIYDEPFSDASQIPTFLLSRLTQEHVTVSLSGDGGDELFAGYGRYLWARRIWNQMGQVPLPLRRAIARALRASSGPLGAGLEKSMPLLPARLRVKRPHDKAARLADILTLASPEALYAQFVSHWKRPDEIVVDGCEYPTAVRDPAGCGFAPDFVERMMYTDLISYLPCDILTKVDRASMAVSLEARVPLLDHRVVEFAWRLPLRQKIRDGQGKWLLRQVLYQYVPKSLIERPKQGFGVPIDEWLRGPLRDWAEALLDERRLRDEGFFNAGPVRERWSEHLAGTASWHYYLWDVLMFQAWLESREFSASPRVEPGCQNARPALT
jgi:asparagine synthase (glutamine-hydrolysing)